MTYKNRLRLQEALMRSNCKLQTDRERSRSLLVIHSQIKLQSNPETVGIASLLILCSENDCPSAIKEVTSIQLVGVLRFYSGTNGVVRIRQHTSINAIEYMMVFDIKYIGKGWCCPTILGNVSNRCDCWFLRIAA